MLERQMKGEVDSWAIRWYWTSFNAGGLTLFPPRSLVMNEGADSNATHGKLGARIRNLLPRKKVSLDETAPTLPDLITVEPKAFFSVKKGLWESTSKFSLKYWLAR